MNPTEESPSQKGAQVLSSEWTGFYQRVELCAATGSILLGSLFCVIGFREPVFILAGLGAIAMGGIWIRFWSKYSRPATKVIMDEHGLIAYEHGTERRVGFGMIESITAARWSRNPTMIVTFRGDSGRFEKVIFYPKFMGFSLLSSFDRIHLLLDTKNREHREKNPPKHPNESSSRTAPRRCQSLFGF